MTHSATKFLIALALGLASQLALAQDAKSGMTRESPKAVWRSERNFKATQKAWDLLAEARYEKAQEQFAKLSRRFRNPYERSQALFGLAQAYMATDNLDGALAAYERVVDLNALPNKPHFEALAQRDRLLAMQATDSVASKTLGTGLLVNAEPLVRVQPLYPRDGALNGIEGSVTVEFTVTKTGDVVDPEVINSNLPSAFAREAVRAIQKWRFKPQISAGQPVSRRARQTLDFML
jgi:protein TonB